MTTVNYQVDGNNDDAFELGNDTGFDAVANVRHDSNTDPNSITLAGHRFTSVAVPKDAQIVTATLQLFVRATANDDANFDIHAEDVDDAVDFAANNDVVNRVRTTASVAWVADSLGVGFKSSPDIKTVIQEIVDRGSWASGNDLMIICKGKTDVTKSCRSTPHDTTPSEAAKLDITYAVRRKRSYARAIL